LHDGGFHSRNVGVPPEEATIEGGFIVTPLAGGGTVIHYEQYVLARWLVPPPSPIPAFPRGGLSREFRGLQRLLAPSRRGAGQQQRAADSGAESQHTALSSGSTVRSSPPGISASARTV